MWYVVCGERRLDRKVLCLLKNSNFSKFWTRRHRHVVAAFRCMIINTCIYLHTHMFIKLYYCVYLCIVFFTKHAHTHTHSRGIIINTRTEGEKTLILCVCFVNEEAFVWGSLCALFKILSLVSNECAYLFNMYGVP